MTASQERVPVAATARSCCSLIRRGLLLLLVAVVALSAIVWFAREALLRAAADLWIVSDDIAPADAAAVFGGGIEDRPFAAAVYYQRGLIKKVLLPNIGQTRAVRLGVIESHVIANRNALLKLGVPETDIDTFGANLTNTREEVLALRDWTERTGAHRIIVPTEIFSTRRVRWMLHRVFTSDVDVRVLALDPGGYGRNDWWKHESGLINFQNEVLKYIFYRFKY